MRIAVIGAGNVGKALGQRWKDAGFEIVYGVRNPATYEGALSVQDAIQISDVILIAIPWRAVSSLQQYLPHFHGNIVIDATNPIKPDFSGLELGHTDSAGETIGRLIPGAKVVKAFNTCGYNVMADPSFNGERSSMLIAGDDREAKQMVIDLSSRIGFEAIDAGPLYQSRYLEAMAWLWISMAIKFGQGREIAFRLLKR